MTRTQSIDTNCHPYDHNAHRIDLTLSTPLLLTQDHICTPRPITGASPLIGSFFPRVQSRSTPLPLTGDISLLSRSFPHPNLSPPSQIFLALTLSLQPATSATPSYPSPTSARSCSPATISKVGDEDGVCIFFFFLEV